MYDSSKDFQDDSLDETRWPCYYAWFTQMTNWLSTQLIQSDFGLSDSKNLTIFVEYCLIFAEVDFFRTVKHDFMPIIIPGKAVQMTICFGGCVNKTTIRYP